MVSTTPAVSTAPDNTIHGITDRAIVERASAIALTEASSGTVAEVEAAPNEGGHRYGVEVAREDGTGVEANVGRDFKLVSVESDD